MVEKKLFPLISIVFSTDGAISLPQTMLHPDGATPQLYQTIQTELDQAISSYTEAENEISRLADQNKALLN